MDRIWMHYKKWEDWKNGFYSNIDKEVLVSKTPKVIEMFKNDDLFYRKGIEVISRWKNCTHYNLSHSGLNRRSYLGQLVALYLYGVPAKYTAKIWSSMDIEIQKNSNATAEKIIEYYEKNVYDGKHENIYGGKNEKIS